MPNLSRSARILLVALALGVGYDLFFHSHAPGLSVPLFVLLLLGALFALGRSTGVPPVRRNLWLLAPLLFLAGMVAVRANPFLTFLNVAATLALLGLVAHYYAAGRPEQLGLLGYPLTWLRVGANALFQAVPVVAGALSRREAPERRDLWPVVRGLLLALPVLSIFACLLASADLVFRRYLGDLVQWHFWRDLLGHAFAILGVAWLLAGGLAYSLARGREEGPGLLDRMLNSVAGAIRSDAEGEDGLERLLAALGRVLSIGMLEASIVLVPVGLLFAAFVGIQVTYLFGGEANITAQGYTYAEYARRGFAELVIVAVLTLALILGLQWLTRRQSPRQQLAFNGLGSLLVALVLVMLASAFQRLRLYEQAYGFTETRLYVYVFMAWLAVALAWFLVTLWRLPKRFAIGALAASLGFLITLNLINPDAFIAQQNLARYQASGKLDAAYLTTLSEDAAPVLIAAVGQVTGEEQRVLQKHLREWGVMVEHDSSRLDWRSFNVARWRGYRLVAGLQ